MKLSPNLSLAVLAATLAQVQAQVIYYSSNSIANGYCDYVCYSYSYGYYCCSGWYGTWWAWIIWACIIIAVIASIAVCIWCCMNTPVEQGAGAVYAGAPAQQDQVYVITAQNGQANMAPAQRVVAQPGQTTVVSQPVQGSPIAQGQPMGQPMPEGTGDSAQPLNPSSQMNAQLNQ